MTIFGSEDRVTVAADTGPLLSVFQSNTTGFLRRYFSRIIIVQSQLAEFQKHSAATEIQSLIDEGLVVVIQNLTDKEKVEAMEVARRIATEPSCRDSIVQNHLPEAELIVVSQRLELQCKKILLDEKAARSVAEALGLEISGFLGILANAGFDGLLTKDEIRQLLQGCQRQGTHYASSLIEHVAQTYGR